MATLNDIADALETTLAAIDDELTAYSESAEAPLGTVTAEVFFRGRERRTHGSAGLQHVDAVIELSTGASGPDWSAGIRRIREYSDYQGSKSIEAAIEADTTLGSVVEYIILSAVGDEVRKKFPDGWRWTTELVFGVRYHPD